MQCEWLPPLRRWFALLLALQFLSFTWAQESVPTTIAQTKDEQLRQIQIEQARQAMKLAKTLMERKKNDWDELQKLADQDIAWCDRNTRTHSAPTIRRAATTLRPGRICVGRWAWMSEPVCALLDKALPEWYHCRTCTDYRRWGFA